MAIIATLPDNIQNGQVIDATAVMANFNQIVSNVNGNAAGLAQTNIFTGLLVPSSVIGVQGTTAGDNAQAGSIGEYISASAASSSISSATAVNMATMSLTAGDWDVGGQFSVIPAAGTTVAAFEAATSTTSASLAGLGLVAMQFTSAAGATQIVALPQQRLNLIATTTVYLVGYSSFTGGACNVAGTMWARRAR